MPKQVRDSKESELGPQEVPVKSIDHGNAAILTAKFLDLILLELKAIRNLLEERDG